MAKPEALVAYKFPLTEKPITSPLERATYGDLFNIQNTLRLMMGVFVEEAPIDDKSYARKDQGWVEVTSSGWDPSEATEVFSVESGDYMLMLRNGAVVKIAIATSPTPVNAVTVNGVPVTVNGEYVIVVD